MPLRKPIVLSPSRTETSAGCHRKHFAADVLDRHMGKKDGANFGTCVHHGIGDYYDSCDIFGSNGDVNRAARRATKSWTDLRPEGDKNSHTMLGAIMEYYLSRAKTGILLAPSCLPKHRGSWYLAEVNGKRMVEERIVIAVDGHELSFQLDRLLTNGTNYAIIDTKTAARVDNKWRTQWPISIQQRLYRWATQEWMRQNGIQFDNFYGCIEGIHKAVPIGITSILLPQWSESELGEAKRLWKANADKDLAVIDEGLRQAIETYGEGFSDTQLREAIEEIAFTHTEFNYGHCWSYGKCPYWDICRAPPEARSGMIKEFHIETVEGY